MGKILIFNWKMNLPILSSWSEVIKSSTPSFFKKERGNRVIVCPPFTHIAKVKELLAGTEVIVGAQDVSIESQGAFTGEVSAAMLKDLGIGYSIIGHSERRYIFGESDEMISKKINQAVSNGIIPVLCVGEKDQMDEESAWNFVKNQLDLDLALITLSPTPYTLIVAYEPVWAIGGDKETNAPHSVALIGRIKEYLLPRIPNSEFRIPVLYGGSLSSKNIATFLEYNQIDGFLVGSASLDEKEVEKLLQLI